MSVVRQIRRAVLGARRHMAESADVDRRFFIYVKIPESVAPIDRGEKYEDPRRSFGS